MYTLSLSSSFSLSHAYSLALSLLLSLLVSLFHLFALIFFDLALHCFLFHFFYFFSKFHLDKNEIECLDFIACGVSGSVFVGQYRKQNVALKFYQQMSKLHTSKSRGSSLNNSWKEETEKKMVDAKYFKDNVKEFVEGKMVCNLFYFFF